jgi:hypothetical protein
MSHRNIHEWRTETEDGEKRFVRAHKFGGQWRVLAKLKGDEDWTPYPTPLLQDLVELRRVLFAKYRRKHLAWEDVLAIERMIKERGGVLEPLQG